MWLVGDLSHLIGRRQHHSQVGVITDPWGCPPITLFSANTFLMTSSVNPQTPTGSRDKHWPLCPKHWPDGKRLPTGRAAARQVRVTEKGDPPSLTVVISLVLTLTVFLDTEYVVNKSVLTDS